MSTSDDPQWQKHDLGDGTIVKISKRGVIQLEQTTGGELVTIWLEPEQLQALIKELEA